jgi:hypothetical protein
MADAKLTSAEIIGIRIFPPPAFSPILIVLFVLRVDLLGKPERMTLTGNRA